MCQFSGEISSIDVRHVIGGGLEIDHWLVVDLPLWKMMEFVSWGYDIANIWKVIIQSCSKPPTRDGLTFTSHIDHNLCFHIPQFLLSLAQSYHEVMTMDRRILKGFAMENPIRRGTTIPKRTWENGQLMFRSWPWHIYCYLACSSSSFFYIFLMSS
jgi:hypothetical protein